MINAKHHVLPSGAGAAPLKRTVTIVANPVDASVLYSGPLRHRQAAMRAATIEAAKDKGPQTVAAVRDVAAPAGAAMLASALSAAAECISDTPLAHVSAALGSGSLHAQTTEMVPLEQRVYASQASSAEFVRKFGMPCNLALGANYMPNIALIGCIGQLERLGLMSEVRNFAGCEGGAIISALLAVGLSVAKIGEHAIAADFAKIMRPGAFASRKFAKRHGVLNGKRLVAAFKAILRAESIDDNITLRGVQALRGGRVVFAAIRLSDTRPVYIDYRTHPDMKLWEAVRIAVSIPTIMQPATYAGERYVSAGAVVGLPIDAFHYNSADHPINQRTIGLLAVCDGISSKPKSSLGATLAAVLDCALSTAQRLPIDEQDRARTIVVDCGKMSSLDFGLSCDARRELMDVGATAVVNHFAFGPAPLDNKYGVAHNGFDLTDEPQATEAVAVTSVLRRGATSVQL